MAYLIVISSPNPLYVSYVTESNFCDYLVSVQPFVHLYQGSGTKTIALPQIFHSFAPLHPSVIFVEVVAFDIAKKHLI
jgi:hypothetical protein